MAQNGGMYNSIRGVGYPGFSEGGGRDPPNKLTSQTIGFGGGGGLGGARPPSAPSVYIPVYCVVNIFARFSLFSHY